MSADRSRARWTSYGVIFAAGLFALVAQVLLFRTFLTVYEGNELGLGVFFCSWLFWGAVGAMAGRWRRLCWDRWIKRFAFVPLLLIPACAAQLWLILHARSVSGVAAYEIFPFARMLPAAWLGNAPVGLVTGLLFTLACAWVARNHAVPVAHVFVVEAAGSFTGGVLVTVLLGVGLAEATVAGWAALVVALATLAEARPRWIAALPVAVLMALLMGRVDDTIDRTIEARGWGRFLPVTAYQGSFATPHAKYLYGSYQDQFQVVAWETIADSVPGTEQASRIVATHLSQHPDARRALVLGSVGYGICRRLLEIPQLDQVAWFDPDPYYPGRLMSVLPEALQTDSEKLLIPGTDIQRYLTDVDEPFGLVILNLPPVTSLALNRFCSVEFFELIRDRLTDRGVLGIRVTGGENVMGDELVNMGASTYHTLHSVFDEVVIRPGDETWLLASNGGALVEDTATLRERFAAIPGAPSVYPPDAVPDLFPQGRIAFQRNRYRQAIAVDAEGLLLNSDRRPRALLHSLLFAAREAGAGEGWTTWLRAFAAVGAPLAPLAIGILVVLRVVYLVVGSRRYGVGAERRGQPFDWYLVVGGAGAVSMALSILLMFTYQARYGSLFLHVGLVSALFMMGLALGGRLCEYLVGQRGVAALRLLLFAIAIELGLLLVLHATSGAWPEWVFGALFLGAGLLGGLYLPLAAAVLKADGLADPVAGGGLAWSDSLGGAAAGILTGLVVLPVFGSGYTLALCAGLLPALVVPLTVRTRAGRAEQPDDRIRPVGYTLFGTAAVMMCCSVWLARAGSRDAQALLETALYEMAPDETFELRAQPVVHFAGESGYCFATDDLTGRAGGYGGRISLAVLTDRDGLLRDVRVLRSHETPAYFELIRPWLKGLAGRPLFVPVDPTDGVTGATLTSQGILDTLHEAGQRFAGQSAGAPAHGRSLPDIRLAVLAGLAAAALWLRGRPDRTVRRLYLAVVVVVTGLWLNVQYSMAHVLALVGLNVPPPGLNLAFVVMVGIPLLVLLAGNVYCGYLCPFGALQELIGELRPARIRMGPDTRIWRWGRQVKWGLLFLFVVLLAVGRNEDLSAADPLVKVFGHDAGGTFAGVVVAILALSVFYPRFWCRNLCPTGAFLSLLNGAKGLRCWRPTVTHKQCSFGVTGKYQLDCLTCVRCRRVAGRERQLLVPPSPQTSRLRNLAFAGSVTLMALWMFQQTYAIPKPEIIASRVDTTHGESRTIDPSEIRWRMEQGRLSDHEALYYGPVGAITNTTAVPHPDVP